MRGAQHGSPPWKSASRPAGAGGDGLVHVGFAVARHSRPPRDHRLWRVAGVACWWLAGLLVGGRDIWISIGGFVLPWPVPRRFLAVVLAAVVFIAAVMAWTHPPWWWAQARTWLTR